MSDIKFFPKLTLIAVVLVVALIYISYSHHIQKIQSLSQRIESLNHEIQQALPEHFSSINHYNSSMSVSKSQVCGGIKDKITAVKAVQLERLFDDENEMDKFNHSMNAYQAHIHQCWDKFKNHSKTSKEAAQEWAQLERSLKALFLKLQILSSWTKNFNRLLDNGGDMYANVLFLNREPVPEMQIDSISMD